MRNIKKIKRWRLWNRTLEIFVKELCSPLTDSWATFGILQIPANFALIYLLLGKAQMLEEASLTTIAAISFIFLLPIWAVISFLKAPFIAIKEERELGQWTENRFSYFEPRRIFSGLVGPEDGKQTHEIDLSDLESSVRLCYSVEHDGNIHAAGWQVYGNWKHYQEGESLISKGGGIGMKKNQKEATLMEDKKLKIEIEAAEFTREPTHFKLYLHFWEIWNG